MAPPQIGSCLCPPHGPSLSSSVEDTVTGACVSSAFPLPSLPTSIPFDQQLLAGQGVGRQGPESAQACPAPGSIPIDRSPGEAAASQGQGAGTMDQTGQAPGHSLVCLFTLDLCVVISLLQARTRGPAPVGPRRCCRIVLTTVTVVPVLDQAPQLRDLILSSSPMRGLSGGPVGALGSSHSTGSRGGPTSDVTCPGTHRGR